LYIAFASIRPGNCSIPRIDQPLAAGLRDWMPFVLSAAITAGVAPLLFIQIVYQYQFYSANLLLWWRWMLVVPVLIVAFYLLYLIKSSRLWGWPHVVRAIVTLGTASCFVFVGFCWTANHLLANSQSSWPEVYATGSLPLMASIVIPRMLVWIGGSFATMSVIAGWQLLPRQSLASEPIFEAEVGMLARLSVGGLAVALLAGIVYIAQADSAVRTLLSGYSFLPYVIGTFAGLILQGIGWGLQWRSKRLHVVGLSSASVGCVISLLATSAIREGVRVQTVDLASIVQRHAAAAQVGGFAVFVIAAIVVGILIGWCIRMVQEHS
jgi:hypothetical protein